MADQRSTYIQIKSQVLGSYFHFCRDHACLQGRPHEQVMGAVDYDLECTYEKPLEKVMLWLVELVLSGGWYPLPDKTLRKNIAEVLAKHELDVLLASIPEEERNAFLFDFRRLHVGERSNGE